MTSSSSLSPTQRYAAGALFGLALHHAQIHQTHLLGFSSAPDGVSDFSERVSNSSSTDSISDDPHLWIHESAALLRPVFRCLEIDSMAWTGLEETAGLTPANHHIGAYLRLLSEENDDASPERRDRELALSNGINAMAKSMETSHSDIETKTEKRREYEHECRHKFSTEKKSNEEVADTSVDTKLEAPPDMITFEEVANEEVANTNVVTRQEAPNDMITFEEAKSQPGSLIDDKPSEEIRMLSDEKKLAVLYELLSACLADIPEDSKKVKKRRIGYDARYRVALRLLTTWFDIKWIKMEAIENMVTCSAMAIAKEEQLKEEENKTPVSSWAKWKRGGIIGAAALTGGALMAVTGGLAAPAIAAGLGALAPTLGTIIPVIGASGFAAAASAAGGVVGSVAVAASFGAAGAGLTGSKMARRTGGIDEFEFKAIGENHNQGRLAVEILVSGFVFEEKDFILPWQGLRDNLERYALQWESKNLIAVSTAIQDWLTSRVALGLMKQGAMLTVLSSLLVALAWPATLIAATDFIDSKWAIAVDRSNKAGKLLAEVLVKGLQGQRPVTLVGFSLGARVIYKCLQELAESGHNAEIVERVVLLGAPISIKGENWDAARKVVAGRFVNAYTTNDWMLGVAFRASLLSQGLAGIQPINVPGIENVDVTEFVDGHSSYLWASQQILEKLEIETYYPVFGSTLFKP